MTTQHTPEYYDRQYNNRLFIPDAADYSARAIERSAAARRALPCYLDVPYGESPRERMDLFPARRSGAPVLCFIHGGYWRSREKSEFSFIARPFVDAGCTVAIPTYDLAPAVTVETIVRQMLAAHAWLWRNVAAYNGDPARIVVAGHSAGGHLTAMMACAQWESHAADLPPDLVKGGLAVSGLYDLAPIVHVSFNSDVRLDAASARHASPVTYRPARPVPLVTAVGSLESDEFKRQARALAMAWPHCVRGHLDVPGCHHLSVLEALADPPNALFAKAMALVEAA